jgi:hypothetical protein
MMLEFGCPSRATWPLPGAASRNPLSNRVRRVLARSGRQTLADPPPVPHSRSPVVNDCYRWQERGEVR